MASMAPVFMPKAHKLSWPSRSVVSIMWMVFIGLENNRSNVIDSSSLCLQDSPRHAPPIGRIAAGEHFITVQIAIEIAIDSAAPAIARRHAGKSYGLNVAPIAVE